MASKVPDLAVSFLICNGGENTGAVTAEVDTFQVWRLPTAPAVAWHCSELSFEESLTAWTSFSSFGLLILAAARTPRVSGK